MKTKFLKYIFMLLAYTVYSVPGAQRAYAVGLTERRDCSGS